MPAYNTPMAGGQFTELSPGTGPLFLFNAESPSASSASIAFARGTSASFDDGGTTFQMLFSGTPSAGVVEILATNVYQYPGKTFTLTDWTVVYISTATQTQSYTDIGRSMFYCAYVTGATGGAITITAQR